MNKKKIELYKDWLGFLEVVEAYFIKNQYLKIRTPKLVASGAMEFSLEAFETKDLNGKTYFLPTSPEFALKKLWMSGVSDSIFEVGPSYRKGEMGDLHLPEFTMLEFYRSDKNLEYLQKEIRDFFTTVLGVTSDKWSVVSLPELFKVTTGFELKPDAGVQDLKDVLKYHSISFGEDYNWNDLFQLIFMEILEKSLNPLNPIFLTNYPPQIAALAKINKFGWASRLEIYWKGVELGNGYDELFDANEILERWSEQNMLRKSDGKTPHPVDSELIKITVDSHIKKGVGMAIGLERLFAVARDLKSIKTWPL